MDALQREEAAQRSQQQKHNMNYHNNENQTDNNNNEDDDDDLVKLETEMQEEELIFEKMQDVDLEAQEEPEFWPLRIKSVRDIRIQVRPTDSIGEVKQAVVEGLQKCDEAVSASGSHHYVRLVCRGRLLAPDSAPLNTCGVLIQPNDVIHAVLTKQQQQQSSGGGGRGRRQGGVQAALQQGSTQRLSRRALRSAGINTDGLAVRRTATEDQEDEDDDDSVSSQEDFSSGASRNNNRNYNSFLQRRGFDRLRSLGLRRGEIHALRSYFSRHVDRFVQQREQDGESPERRSTTTEDTTNDDEENHPEASSDPLMRRRLQEEAWMQSQGPLSEFRLNLPSGGGLALMSLLRSNRNTANNGGGAENNGNNNNPWLSTANTNTAGNNNNATTTTTTNTSRQQQGAERDAEFLCGFLLGFFVGPMMLIWVWLPTVPHRQKFGILTGITVQLAVTALGLAPQPPDTTTNPAEDGIETDGTFLELAGWRYGGYGQLLAEQQQQQLQEVTDDQVILG